MLLLILKSSTCLAVLMLLYKVCLEKTSAHIFKRFYLIGAIIISIIIPFITFTTYVEVEPVSLIPTSEFIENSSIEPIETIQTKNYFPTILWSIYTIGVIVFSFRFFKNLYQLIQKIKTNPKYKNQNFINVLITDLITPHTFFNYIFLNKTKFENNLIPTEVILHEQTHAKQKHALDILFIEVLQILFWFNPLLYTIKKDIKLNHEFLADQSVLKQGIDSSTYQNILLAFSSNASHLPLTNAINYSLIKKRFTVMKTHTSKTALWLRSFIILPLLAILIYGFSDKVVAQKETNNLNSTKESTITNNEIKIFIDKNRSVFINNNEVDFNKISNELIKVKNNLIKENSSIPTLFIEVEGHLTETYLNDIMNEIEKSELKIAILSAGTITFDKNKLDKESFKKLNNINYTANDSVIFIQKKVSKKDDLIIKIIDNETVFINDEKCPIESLESRIIELIKDIPSKEKEKLTPAIIYNSPDGDKTLAVLNNILRKHKLLRINKETKMNISLETDVLNTNNLSNQQKATPEEILEYNKIIKKYNSLPEGQRIIKVKDKNRMEHIYRLMTPTQKNKNEEFPNFITAAPRPQPFQQKATLKEIEEYNKLAKKFKANPDGAFKEKEIKRIITLYNTLTKEKKRQQRKCLLLKCRNQSLKMRLQKKLKIIIKTLIIGKHFLRT